VADEPSGLVPQKPEQDSGKYEPKGNENPATGNVQVTDQPQTFDAEYVKKLRDEAAGYRKRAQEAEAKWQEHEDANASEVEKLTKQREREQKRADEAQAKLLRFEVAAEKKVPAELTPLLTGSTKEELESQATLLLDNLNAARKPDFDGGAREPAPEAVSPEQAHNRDILALLGIRQEQQT
jgi:hypothetical protein